MKFGRGARLAVRLIHGARRRGRAVAASPPHLKDRGLRESMKIKGGTNGPENLSADRFETDGAETQLSPTTMPIDAINGFGAIPNFRPNSDFHEGRVQNLRCTRRHLPWRSKLAENV